MPLVLETSPAIVTKTTAPFTCTTASFTPPAGSTLIVAYAGNSGGGTTPPAPTITDSLAVDLPYRLIAFCSHADAPVKDGVAAMWQTPVVGAVSMTISVTNGDSGSGEGALKVWVFTGTERNNPIGAFGKLPQNSGTAISRDYTAQRTSGRGVMVVTDWDAIGVMSAGTGCTLTGGGSALITGIAYGFFLRTTADDVVGTTNTMNATLLASGTSTQTVWAELVPESPPDLVHPPLQAVHRSRIW